MRSVISVFVLPFGVIKNNNKYIDCEASSRISMTKQAITMATDNKHRDFVVAVSPLNGNENGASVSTASAWTFSSGPAGAAFPLPLPLPRRRRSRPLCVPIVLSRFRVVKYGRESSTNLCRPSRPVHGEAAAATAARSSHVASYHTVGTLRQSPLNS